MNNREVAHKWANRSRQEGSGSNLFFRGDTIYSYGDHFPIARHVDGVILFTTRGYSSTTAKHKSYTIGTCSHKQVFFVDDPTAKPSKAHLKAYAERIRDLELKVGRARNVEFALQRLEREVEEANKFAEHFGFETRFKINVDLEELREKAKLQAERERKARDARDRKLEAEIKETIFNWKQGAPVQIPWAYQKVLLRARNGQMETSKGAIVPLADAERTFRFVRQMRERGWRRNGEQHRIGDYQLDAVNEQEVIAGCHRVGWDEIERFAGSQGWA